MNQNIVVQLEPSGKKRNELARQNSTSRDKSAPARAPITDIRKKQSSTLNVDDNSVILTSNNHRQAESNSRAKGQNTSSTPGEIINLSLDREIMMQQPRMNQSTLGTA